MKLMILWGSSRQGRGGEPVAQWVKRHAGQDDRFEVDFVDLRELNLPFYDEPGRSGPFTFESGRESYTNPQGKAWAERVERIEGLIIVTPEYNHGYPAVLKNTLDWVGPEWVDKPAGFVSYGGVSGGARAIEQLRPVTIELGLVQVANPIHFVFYRQIFSGNGEPKDGLNNDNLQKMFDELIRLRQIFSRPSP